MPLLLLIHITTSLRLQPEPTHPKLPHVIYIIFLFQLLNVYPWTTLVSFWSTDFTFKYTFYWKILRCSAVCYIHESTALKICISNSSEVRNFILKFNAAKRFGCLFDFAIHLMTSCSVYRYYFLNDIYRALRICIYISWLRKFKRCVYRVFRK